MIRTTQLPPRPKNTYPTSDGKPMAETDLHRDLMTALIETLKLHFAADPAVYVSGNLLVFYEKGNKRRHVSPDVFVVPGIGGQMRENYLLWEEGRGLDVVIEVTSKTTRREDLGTKHRLYLEKLAVKEYFLFDPREEYLDPSFQGYRRRGDRFVRLKPADGRLYSQVLKLHLERDGTQLRLWDPVTSKRVPTPAEARQAATERAEAEAERAEAEAERAEAEAERAEAEKARAKASERRAETEKTRADRAEADAERLRREVEVLLRRLGNGA